MSVFHDWNHWPPRLRGGGLSIGNFDGVHRGHAELVKRLVAVSRALDGPAVVFTFDPHPSTLLRPDRAPMPLMTVEDKALALAALGVDGVFVYRTDHDLLNLSPENFFTHVVRERLDARAIVEGADFRFGKQRRGDVVTLAKLAAAAGIPFEVVSPVPCDGQIVSSSLIRQSLAAGEIAAAERMLGHAYSVTGVVVGGARRARQLGFPTANLEQVATLLPAAGVYAGVVEILGDSVTTTIPRPAVINLGPSPTFGEQGLKFEAHILDFDGDLYGMTLRVTFRYRVRDIRAFADIASLKQQIKDDALTARRWLADPSLAAAHIAAIEEMSTTKIEKSKEQA